MRILIDAMGGDNAPGEIVRGAVEASREFHVDVALVGREAEILACLNEMDVMPGEHIQIVNAPDVISMEDDPSTATRKKPESSMSVALQLLHRGEGDAVISAGSTGALLSGATPVSYTHLDVYKRQARSSANGSFRSAARRSGQRALM